MGAVFPPPRTLAKGALRRRPDGFTLIELLVAIAVVGVLSAAALPSFTYLITSNRTKDAATDLYIALAKARSEAVKRNASVSLTPNAAGWQAGWQVLDASNAVLDDHGAVSGVVITPGGPGSIVYQSSGRIAGAAVPSFLITANANPTVKRCVRAALSGRPYVKASAC